MPFDNSKLYRGIHQTVFYLITSPLRGETFVTQKRCGREDQTWR